MPKFSYTDSQSVLNFMNDAFAVDFHLLESNASASVTFIY